jgi:hypothetical protein
MKKLLLTTLITAALAGSVLAQGTVSIAGSLKYSTDGGTTLVSVAKGTSSLGTYGAFNVAIYYGTDLTGPFGSSTAGAINGDWTLGAPLSKISGATVGTLAANTVTLGSAATEQVFVVGWTGTYQDWNTALANAGANHLFGWSGSTLSGGSLDWAQAVSVGVGTNPPGTPTGLQTGAGGYNGMVMAPLIVPEPTSFALAGLGLASLLIFRRRS